MEYRITTSQTIARDYVVTAETEQQARDIWRDKLTSSDAEQEYYCRAGDEGAEKVETIEAKGE